MKQHDDDLPIDIDWLRETAPPGVQFYIASVEVPISGPQLNANATGRWFLSLGRKVRGDRTVRLSSELQSPPYARCEIYIGAVSTRAEWRRMYEQYANSYWPSESRASNQPNPLTRSNRSEQTSQRDDLE